MSVAFEMKTGRSADVLSRFVGPLAHLIEDDRKRSRRLKQTGTPEQYRRIQAEAFARMAKGRALSLAQKRSWRLRVGGGRMVET